MTGIIFTGGEGPSPQIVRKLFEQEKSKPRCAKTIIIAADSGLLAAERAGFKPDWIIGDMDSLTELSSEAEAILACYPQECVIRHQRDKDYTDTELAFFHAVKQNCDEIWIIGGGGGRLDHLFGIRSLFERDIFPYRWTTDTADIRCIEKNGELKIDGEKGALVSVFPLGIGPWEAKSEGLKWALEGVSWDRGFFGLSNVAVNNGVSIVAKQGRFMVVLPYMDK